MEGLNSYHRVCSGAFEVEKIKAPNILRGKAHPVQHVRFHVAWPHFCSACRKLSELVSVPIHSGAEILILLEY